MPAAHRRSGGSRTRSPLPKVLLGLLLLGMTACATSERQNLLERSASYVTYRLPAEQLLDVARALLEEQGYRILASTDPHYVRTGWKVKFDESLDTGAFGERHFVLVKPLADGRVVLNAYRLTYVTIGRTAPHPGTPKNNGTSGNQMMIEGDPLSHAPPELVRDLDLEWQILSRVSPATARALESQVDQYLGGKSR